MYTKVKFYTRRGVDKNEYPDFEWIFALSENEINEYFYILKNKYSFSFQESTKEEYLHYHSDNINKIINLNK